MFPDKTRVADNLGIVYNTSDLGYAASFATVLDDLAFSGEIPIVLAGDRLISYSATFLRTGEHVLSTPALEIEISGNDIVAFFDNDGSLAAEVVPLSSFVPPQAGDPLDPRGIAFDPDGIELDTRSTVYLLDSGLHCVFRYSIPSRDYLTTIPLHGAPQHMAYSGATDTLYLGYPSGAPSPWPWPWLLPSSPAPMW